MRLHWTGKSYYTIESYNKEEWDAVEWRQIREFPNYWVSSKGKVFNKKTGRFVGFMHKGSHAKSKKYSAVTLHANGGSTSMEVHRIMSWLFLGEVYDVLHHALPEVKWEVDHIDGNCANNDIDNLRWLHPRWNNKKKGDNHAKKSKI